MQRGRPFLNSHAIPPVCCWVWQILNPAQPLPVFFKINMLLSFFLISANLLTHFCTSLFSRVTTLPSCQGPTSSRLVCATPHPVSKTPKGLFAGCMGIVLVKEMEAKFVFSGAGGGNLLFLRKLRVGSSPPTAATARSLPRPWGEWQLLVGCTN